MGLKLDDNVCKCLLLSVLCIVVVGMVLKETGYLNGGVVDNGVKEGDVVERFGPYAQTFSVKEIIPFLYPQPKVSKDPFSVGYLTLKKITPLLKIGDPLWEFVVHNMKGEAQSPTLHVPFKDIPKNTKLANIAIHLYPTYLHNTKYIIVRDKTYRAGKFVPLTHYKLVITDGKGVISAATDPDAAGIELLMQIPLFQQPSRCYMGVPAKATSIVAAQALNSSGKLPIEYNSKTFFVTSLKSTDVCLFCHADAYNYIALFGPANGTATSYIQELLTKLGNNEFVATSITGSSTKKPSTQPAGSTTSVSPKDFATHYKDIIDLIFITPTTPPGSVGNTDTNIEVKYITKV